MPRVAWTGPALALAGILLAACGSVQAGGGAAGAATTASSASSTGTTPGDAGYPTSVAAVPAPPRFVDRADVVAEAVRRAGVPVAPQVPVLLSSWAVDEGFETDVQKVAWGHGHVALPPGVASQDGGRGTMQLPDGSTRAVAVVGVRESLNRALDGALDAPAACDGIPAADCRITVSSATRTDVSVDTTTGRATVPAWRLTIDGLSHSISVIAVADGAVTRPTTPTPLPGLPDVPQGFNGSGDLDAVEPASLTIRIVHGACETALAAHVVEFDDLVVVGATSNPPGPDTICPAVLLSTPAVLPLTRPLGDRVVIDIVTGTPRFLKVPVF